MLLSKEPNNTGRSVENLNARLLIHTDIKVRNLEREIGFGSMSREIKCRNRKNIKMQIASERPDGMFLEFTPFEIDNLLAFVSS